MTERAGEGESQDHAVGRVVISNRITSGPSGSEVCGRCGQRLRKVKGIYVHDR